MTTEAITPLRQRMIEDMNARKLGPHSQRSHIYSCMRFAAFLKRSPETATREDIRQFQLHLAETGTSICNRNRIMTGVRFLFRVTLRRHGLAAEVWHIKEPQKLPPVLSPEEVGWQPSTRSLARPRAAAGGKTSAEPAGPPSPFLRRGRSVLGLPGGSGQGEDVLSWWATPARSYGLVRAPTNFWLSSHFVALV